MLAAKKAADEEFAKNEEAKRLATLAQAENLKNFHTQQIVSFN